MNKFDKEFGDAITVIFDGAKAIEDCYEGITTDIRIQIATEIWKKLYDAKKDLPPMDLPEQPPLPKSPPCPICGQESFPRTIKNGEVTEHICRNRHVWPKEDTKSVPPNLFVGTPPCPKCGFIYTTGVSYARDGSLTGYRCGQCSRTWPVKPPEPAAMDCSPAELEKIAAHAAAVLDTMRTDGTLHQLIVHLDSRVKRELAIKLLDEHATQGTLSQVTYNVRTDTAMALSNHLTNAIEMNSVKPDPLKVPLSPKDAATLNVCRICRRPAYGNTFGRLVMDFGNEFAHETCLGMEETDKNAKTK